MLCLFDQKAKKAKSDLPVCPLARLPKPALGQLIKNRFAPTGKTPFARLAKFPSGQLVGCQFASLPKPALGQMNNDSFTRTGKTPLADLANLPLAALAKPLFAGLPIWPNTPLAKPPSGRHHRDAQFTPIHAELDRVRDYTTPRR